MRWPFRKKSSPGDDHPPAPTPIPGPGMEVPGPPRPRPSRPEPERPRGSLGNAWSPEAPAEWADPADAEEFERLNRLGLEQARADRESGRWPPCGILGIALVFPKVGAVKRDLVALGEALAGWRDRHGEDVVGVSGLDLLEAGCYPPMEIYMGCMNSRTMYAPGWEICPVQISARGRLFELEILLASLEDELPPGSYSQVGTFLPD